MKIGRDRYDSIMEYISATHPAEVHVTIDQWRMDSYMSVDPDMRISHYRYIHSNGHMWIPWQERQCPSRVTIALSRGGNHEVYTDIDPETPCIGSLESTALDGERNYWIRCTVSDECFNGMTAFLVEREKMPSLNCLWQFAIVGFRSKEFAGAEIRTLPVIEAGIRLSKGMRELESEK